MTPLDDAFLAGLTRRMARTATHYDRSGQFPHANVGHLQARGLLSLVVPERFGGAGADLETTRRVVTAIARGEPSTALIVTMHYLQHLRLQRSVRWPSIWQQRLALDAVEAGALINALRVEPDLGTPARGGMPATLARRTADGWQLEGRKTYTTGSHGLTWLLVWARSDDDTPEIGYWLVHKDSPGVRIEESWDHLGMRATCSHDIVFEQVFVPRDQAVETTLAGDTSIAADSEEKRWQSVLLASVYHGIALAARDDFIDWLRARAPSNLGAPLATLTTFQQRVGEIDSLLLASRVLLEAAAAGTLAEKDALALKYLVTRQSIDAVRLALESGGNPALNRKNALERHYRNVLCGRVHTPQDDSALTAIGRAALST